LNLPCKKVKADQGGKSGAARVKKLDKVLIYYYQKSFRASTGKAKQQKGGNQRPGNLVERTTI